MNLHGTAMMQIIESDNHRAVSALTPALKSMLEGYDCPAILVSKEYVILATNKWYVDAFGDIDGNKISHCYQVSHGYSVPCDRAGEDCPLREAKRTGYKARVLHIHQTPRGKEHVDVEMIPIFNADKEIEFFVELLKPIPLATGAVSDKKMVGKTAVFNELLEKITRVGQTNASVLLLGESGTGKELAAKAIHMASDRKDRPLVTLECAGLTNTLFESELFGHVKGAFTGAHTQKKGLVELAEGGTLFLDEIGDVPLHMQIKLLRLIESRSFRPVGSAETKNADFRLICATHKNIEMLVEDGEFRQDLFYRINVFPIYLPSLRERQSDIPLIVNHFIKELSPDRDYHVTDSGMKLLVDHQFKGNIRELRNIIMRAIILTDTNMIERKTVVDSISEGGLPGFDGTISMSTCLDEDQKGSLKEAEKKHLTHLMKKYNNDKSRVAQVAGISLRSLYRKLDDHNLGGR